MKKVKYAWIVWLVFVIIFFFPYDLAFIFDGIDKDELVIRSQECGCSCPDVKIVSGKLIIPDSLKGKINDSMLEADLTGADPFYQPENYWNNMKVKGEVIGTNPDYCTENSCYYTPLFKVTSYKLFDYVPFAGAWNPYFMVAYIISEGMFFLVLLSFTIYFLIKKWKEKVKH